LEDVGVSTGDTGSVGATDVTYSKKLSVSMGPEQGKVLTSLVGGTGLSDILAHYQTGGQEAGEDGGGEAHGELSSGLSGWIGCWTSLLGSLRKRAMSSFIQ
jgi:hypothetical protein